MKQNLMKPLIALLLGALMMGSCKKYPSGVGPEYYSAQSGFQVTENFTVVNSTDTKVEELSFATGLPYNFKASFNQRVDWTITVKSTTSNATKVIKGSSTKIDNTNSKWLGGHTGSQTTFFKTGDVCIAELSFLGSSQVLKDTFTVKTVRDFNTTDVIVLGYSNFETTPGATWWNQFSFSQNVENTIGKTNNDKTKSIEGNKYFEMIATPAATSCDAKMYFTGAVQHRLHASNFDTSKYGFLQNKHTNTKEWTNPDEIYVNMYIYNDGTDINKDSRVSLQFHEADLSNDKNKPIKYLKATNPCAYDKLYTDNKTINTDTARYVPLRAHDPSTDDSWEAAWVVSDLQPGWNLVSKKYSELSTSLSLLDGGSGNKVAEPNRVHRVQVALIANTPGKKCKMTWEYVTITKGKPFNPDDY
ncbi:MAG: hypothetical protein U0V72_04765 [Cytophagales bacterium]